MTQRPPTALVTGGSSGIGLETARGLAARGYAVLLVGRHPTRTPEAAADVAASTGNERVTALRADFGHLDEVVALARTVADRGEPLDVLVHNAGLWHQNRRESADGFEDTLAVNHLAPFVLTHHLRSTLAAEARVVTVSSRLHRKVREIPFDDLQWARRSYRGLGVYGQSKLLNVLFANELARRLPEGQTSNSLHPGDVATNVTRDSRWLSFGIRLAGMLWLKSAEQGAATSLHCACSPQLRGVTGAYFRDCKRRAPHPLAEDRELARRAWTETERLVAAWL